MKYNVAELKEILSAEILQRSAENSEVEFLCIDTRKISFPAKSLFVAVKTSHRNGHDFIKDAYAKGIRNFLVSEHVSLSDANIFLVADTVIALQKLAAFHRRQFHYPVIGITGSNGKTIVKEWLNHLLTPFFNIVRSPRSYNSQIGVPLSIAEMKSDHTLAIIEAGISAKNEMLHLQTIIDPTIGVFTHLGDAHNEGFDSTENKVEEKLRLFKDSKIVVHNADEEKLKGCLPDLIHFDFGKTDTAKVQLRSVRIKERETIVSLHYDNKSFEFILPFTTNAAVENALCCFAACAALAVDLSVVCERMQSLPQPEIRLQLQKALQNSLLINDSYSFDLSSLSTALDFLQQQKETFKTAVILSEIPSKQEGDYLQVLHMLADRKIQRCILIGQQWKSYAAVSVPFPVEYFENAEAFIHNFSSLHFDHEIILIKGAREFRFDELAELFLQQVHQTTMKIDLTAMVHNLKAFKSLLKPETKLMAMVKAFGYGSGGSEPAKLLQYHGVDYLAVAYADEGITLRKDGISAPIMVLNVDAAAFHSLIAYDLEPELFSMPILLSFKKFLSQQGIFNYPVHLKLDTGMHRLGFEEPDIKQVCSVLAESREFAVRSVFTHLAASEDPSSDEFTELQYARFKKMIDQIKSVITYDFITHISNSAAILRHKELESQMVRLGIGLYGVKPAGVPVDLRTVNRLYTTIAQLRHVKKGDAIGYNRRGVVERDSLIATLRIGYADGYSRALGNGVGHVYVNGSYAPVIGSVCMDMIMVDVTDIKGVKEEDEVEILGDHISVEETAENCNTIPYEIFTGISGRVKRVYIME